MNTVVRLLSIDPDKGTAMLFSSKTSSLDPLSTSLHCIDVMLPTTTLLMNVPVRYWLLTKI